MEVILNERTEWRVRQRLMEEPRIPSWEVLLEDGLHGSQATEDFPGSRMRPTGPTRQSVTTKGGPVISEGAEREHA